MTTPTFRSAVKATGLRKSFGDKIALDSIDLHVAEGTIFSLLGPNGAGKTHHGPDPVDTPQYAREPSVGRSHTSENAAGAT